MRELLRLTRNPSGNGSVFTCKISRPLNQPCESPSVAMPAFLFVEKNVFLFFSSFFGRKKKLDYRGSPAVLECVPSLGFAVFISLGLHFRLHQHISLSVRFTTFLDAIPPCPERKV